MNIIIIVLTGQVYILLLCGYFPFQFVYLFT